MLVMNFFPFHVSVIIYQRQSDCALSHITHYVQKLAVQLISLVFEHV